MQCMVVVAGTAGRVRPSQGMVAMIPLNSRYVCAPMYSNVFSCKGLCVLCMSSEYLPCIGASILYSKLYVAVETRMENRIKISSPESGDSPAASSTPTTMPTHNGGNDLCW